MSNSQTPLSNGDTQSPKPSGQTSEASVTQSNVVPGALAGHQATPVPGAENTPVQNSSMPEGQAPVPQQPPAYAEATPTSAAAPGTPADVASAPVVPPASPSVSPASSGGAPASVQPASVAHPGYPTPPAQGVPGASPAASAPVTAQPAPTPYAPAPADGGVGASPAAGQQPPAVAGVGYPTPAPYAAAPMAPNQPGTEDQAFGGQPGVYPPYPAPAPTEASAASQVPPVSQAAAPAAPPASAQGNAGQPAGQSKAFSSVTEQPAAHEQPTAPSSQPAPAGQSPASTQQPSGYPGAPVPAPYGQPSQPGAVLPTAPQQGYAPQPGMPTGQYAPGQQPPYGGYPSSPRPKQKVHPLFIIGGVVLLTIILLFAGCTFFFSKLTSTISDTPKQSYEGAITTGPAPDDGPKATDLIAKELKVSPDKIKVDPSTSQEVKNGRYEHVKFDVDLPLSAFANNPNNPGTASLGNATIPVTIECEGFAPEALIAEKMTVSYEITPQMYDEFNKAYMGVMEATSERSSTKLIDGGVHIETARAVGKDEIVTSFDLMISIAPDGNLTMEPRNGTNKSPYKTTDVTNDLKDMYSGSQPFNVELGAGRLKYTEFNISPSGIKVKRTGDHVHIGELVTASSSTSSNSSTNTNTSTNTSSH